MTQEKMGPLRQRMIEDMRIRRTCDKAQKSHIRAIKDFAKFLQPSPDTATPEDLRVYQLHMTGNGVTPINLQHAYRGTAVLFRHDLRARRDEALHAISHRTAQTARGLQR